MTTNKVVQVEFDEIRSPKTTMKCVLCKKDLKSPKLLPCHHSCCTACLRQHLTACLRHSLKTHEEEQKFCCPICDIIVPLNNNGIEELPLNILADVLNEYSGGKIKAAMCSSCAVVNKEETSTHKCLDCGDTLCKTCSEFHRRPKSLRHHLLVPLEETKTMASGEEFRARKTLICEKHCTSDIQVLKTHYCKKCEVLVCTKCTIQDHQGCLFEEIHEVSKTRKAILLKRAKGDVSKRKQTVESAMSMLDTKQKEQEDYICDKATELYELIEGIKLEKLTKIKEHYEEEKKLLQKILVKENMTQKTLESTFNFVQDFTEFSTNVDFLQNEKAVISQFDEIQKQAENSFSVCLLSIDNKDIHCVEEELRKVFGTICEVKNSKMFKSKIRESVTSCTRQLLDGPVSLGAQAITYENKYLALGTSNTNSIESIDFAPISIGQQSLFGPVSSIGQQGLFGQASSTGQQSSIGQQSLFGQASSIGQQDLFGQASSIGQQGLFGPVSSIGQQGLFGQASSIGQQSLFGQASSSGQQSLFGQASSTGQQSSFGQQGLFGQQSSSGQQKLIPPPSKVSSSSSSSSSSSPLPCELREPTDIHVRGYHTYISDIGGKEMKVAVLENGIHLLKTYTLPESENGNTYLGVGVNSKKEIFISTQSKIYKCVPNETQPMVYLSLQNENASEKIYICLTPNDELVVSGLGSKTQIFNNLGELVTEYNGAEFGIAVTGQVTCDDDSYIYIADSELNRIAVVRHGKTEGFIDTKSLLHHGSSKITFTITKDDMLLLTNGDILCKYEIWDCLF